MSSDPRATVAVCTQNRSRALAATLEAALELEASFPWELLVVDNASTDDTLEVARSFAAREPERVRVAVEPVVGLSAARNLAIRLARGGLVVYLDDDALPVPGWLEAYAAAFGDSAVASAGGPVEPIYQGELPAWLEPRFLTYLSVWDRGPEPCELRYIELPRGANVAYRRDALVRAGGFDRRLGRAGRSLRSCEEIELGLRLERSGLRTLYVPGARVRHRVEAARLTPDWMIRRFAAQGFSEAVTDWKHHGRAGLRDGSARRRESAARARASEPPESLWRRCQLRDESAYRLGSLWAVVFVERWAPAKASPPESVA